MSMGDKKVHVLTRLFGGQGTINIPSWPPHSLKLAFVSLTGGAPRSPQRTWDEKEGAKPHHCFCLM
jgi:Tol biopolymer transport system component